MKYYLKGQHKILVLVVVYTLLNRPTVCSVPLWWLLVDLISFRSATVTKRGRRPAVEVLWPTAQTSIWPLRCPS